MLVDTPIEPGRYSLSIGLAVKGGVFVDLRTAPVRDIFARSYGTRSGGICEPTRRGASLRAPDAYS
jgi:hypothetical protein